jgi:hypothetical protein
MPLEQKRELMRLLPRKALHALRLTAARSAFIEFHRDHDISTPSRKPRPACASRRATSGRPCAPGARRMYRGARRACFARVLGRR